MALMTVGFEAPKPRDVRARAAVLDSSALHARAVLAVNEFERLAYHYWPPNGGASPCVSAAPCRVEVCATESAGLGVVGPEPGALPCLAGRETPCHIGDRTWDARHMFRNRCLDAKIYTDLADRLRSPDEVAAARDTLLIALDSVARQIPGDGWVLGQRTWYLVSAGRADEAVGLLGRTAVPGCRAPDWWCLELTGYALTRARLMDSAAHVFLLSRAALDPDARCAWDDISALLDPGVARDAYARLPCGSEARTAVEARFWWLADPSWLAPGNDRQVEHWAREVERSLMLAWGGTMCDTCRAGRLSNAATKPDAVIRTGLNAAWVDWEIGPFPVGAAATSFTPPGGARVGSASVVTFSQLVCGAFVPIASARYHFAPTASAVSNPLAARASDWAMLEGPPNDPTELLAALSIAIPDSLPARRQSVTMSGDHVSQAEAAATRTGAVLQPMSPCGGPPFVPERFTPVATPAVTQIEAWQTAYFRRGDSGLVVMAVDLAPRRAGESALAHASPLITFHGGSEERWRVGAFAYSGLGTGVGRPRDSVARTFESGPGLRWVSNLSTAWDSLLLGFEIVAPSTAAAPAMLGRTRFGVAPPIEPRQRVQLSDLLLLEPGALPTTLDSAERHALGTTALDTEKVPLFWETYGMTAGERATYTLTVRPRDKTSPGFLARLFGAGRTTPVHVTWADSFLGAAPTDSGRSVWGRSVAVDLRGLPRGVYEIQLTVLVAGQEPVAVTRPIAVGFDHDNR